jgi:hypothetical protein
MTTKKTYGVQRVQPSIVVYFVVICKEIGYSVSFLGSVF